MTTRSRRRTGPSPFQRRVYAVVRRIPRGQVRSYQWVAAQLGNPKAARAVGQALNRNPSPDLTPCHRVVRADGSLGGYAWGLAKKRRLLRQEQRALSRRTSSAEAATRIVIRQ